ncbi:hypothetical protein BG015_012097 [Linnemannia schmuckeri]|uniref:ABC transporter substrate-binding protein PnrA-like domain-containing protein n=1 Tax=Linnemannia schmuckeri TaxID=64567 RepID=A0A9P5RUF4_9FUNG|nr:hypothetical protein BG015_012097 [Linnemannia schmuckeri]
MWTFTTTIVSTLFVVLLATTTTLTLANVGSGSNVNIGLVLQGGPDGTKEGTENALALQGLKDTCLPFLPTGSGYQYKSCTPHTYTPQSETLGAYSGLIPSKTGENDFMMALGYFPSKAIQTAANSNGNKLFAIVDFEFTPPVGNIVSVMFSEDQIGFLAGLIAGEVAKSRGGKVAVIGGVDQPSVRRQVNGFGSGVKIACSTCIAYGLYSGTFESDPKLTTTVANLLTDRKVSVAFNAASIFGTLTLKNLTTQQGIYAIGSGSDEWVTNWAYGSVPGSEHVLTSVQTDYTVLVRSVVQSVLRANLTGGGTVFYGVNTDMRQSAIKLAPAHEAGGVYTKEVEEKLRGYVKDLTMGKLTTGVDHKSGNSRSSGSSSTSVQLLPLTDRSASSSPSANNNKSTDYDENTIPSSHRSEASSNKGNLDRLGRLLFSPVGLFIACLAVQTLDLIGP